MNQAINIDGLVGKKAVAADDAQQRMREGTICGAYLEDQGAGLRPRLVILLYDAAGRLFPIFASSVTLTEIKGA